MDIIELRTKISNYKKDKQSFINDTFLWTNMAIKAINEIPNCNLIFEVPRAKNSASTRTVKKI